ncbi:MAG: hypothetical protein M3N34_07460 [Pseudomonadota bacterium]|nr:hypothetical protein [Pseudomonadota bacterium]
MNMTRDRVQSIGWFTLLTVCTVLTGSLVLRVNAVKSQVQISQRKIIALTRENQFLETEYETRANQQQLSDINDLDFGYKAPDSGQYLENERQLAMLGKPRGVDAPAPIEVASNDEPTVQERSADANVNSSGSSTLGSLVPQMISRAMAAEVPVSTLRRHVDAASLRERLARIDPPEHSE